MARISAEAAERLAAGDKPGSHSEADGNSTSS
jgi:hypothetical protein